MIKTIVTGIPLYKKYRYCFCIFIFSFSPLFCFSQTNSDTSTGKKIIDTVVNLKPTLSATNKDSSVKNGITVGNASVQDSGVTLKPKKKEPNPKKAGLYSALVPGLGQIYDKKYWKLPVIYGGLAIAGYFFEDNLNNYQNYRKAYIGRFNNPYPTDKYVGLYSQDQLKLLQDDYAKYLDLTVLFTGLGYVLQIMDAVVYAHLKNFDISQDLSLKFQPVTTPQGAGIGLVLNIK